MFVKKTLFLLITAVTFFLLATLSGCGKKAPPQWRTMPVEKGDLTVEVTASGTVNPHTVVQVGTQVSGTIAKMYVDFNSTVKKGQLIALLDTTMLHAAVEDARASLLRAQTQANLTKRASERAKTLFDKGLTAQADLDQAEADYEYAKASLSSALAALERTKINLAYAYIISPITGVVINRNVDVGQTVAASFNTPTLFTIADNLARMQVQASIDEADIGEIKVGQKAVFTVDAYPDKQFTGTVSQIRLQPQTVQNVVSYTVMIDVENPDLILMPGMTTNLSIVIHEVSDVLKVPLAALKFTPPQTDNKVAHTRSGKGSRNTENVLAELSKPKDRGTIQGAFSKQKPSGEKQEKIFILENGKPLLVPVKTGLSNAGYVAVEGDVHEGQQVIVGLLVQSKEPAAAQQSPLGGMPRRF